MKSSTPLKYTILIAVVAFLCGVFMPDGCQSGDHINITPDAVYDSLSLVAKNAAVKAKEAQDIAILLEKKVERLEAEKTGIQKRYSEYKSHGREKIQQACPDNEEALSVYDDLVQRCDSMNELSERITEDLHASIESLKIALAQKDTVIRSTEIKFGLKEKDANELQKALKDEKKQRRRSNFKTVIKTIFTVVAVEVVAIGAIIGITQLKK